MWLCPAVGLHPLGAGLLGTWLQPVFLAQAQPFSPGLGVKPRLWQVPHSGAFPSVVELRHCGQSLLEGGEGWGREEAGPRGEEEGIRVPAIESPSPGLLHLPADHGGSVE